jgi:hypothetical protein
MRFKNGLRTTYNVSKKTPVIASFNMEKTKFQSQPVISPIKSKSSLLTKVPFSGKTRETKRKLKIVSVYTDSAMIFRVNKIVQEENPPAQKPTIR